MTFTRGEQITLSISNGQTPEVFLPLGGLQESETEWNHRPIALSALSTGGWQAAAEGSGSRSVRIQGRGLFDAGAGEARLLSVLSAGQFARIRIIFGAQQMEALFHVTQYIRRARRRQLVEARLTLESSGPVLWSPV
jgi:predicted secreted protein